MSWLTENDKDLHYCDGSHRWFNPDVEQTTWESVICDHLLEHAKDRNKAFNPYRNRRDFNMWGGRR